MSFYTRCSPRIKLAAKLVADKHGTTPPSPNRSYLFSFHLQKSCTQMRFSTTSTDDFCVYSILFSIRPYTLRVHDLNRTINLSGGKIKTISTEWSFTILFRIIVRSPANSRMEQYACPEFGRTGMFVHNLLFEKSFLTWFETKENF